ncbi:MAG TPA: polysaccharide deacetylase family protein, partial [Miltoncostaea sp.]|nr:polysaccharide deacetylase family protein [Miltoncostaea sp.]
DLRVTVRSRRPLPLGRGAGVCLQIALGARKAHREVCLHAGHHRRARIRVAGRPRAAADVAITRLGRNALRVSVPARDLRLPTRTRIRVWATTGRAGTTPASPEATLAWAPWRIVGCRPAGDAVVRQGPAGARTVGLSFDDGPGAATPAILDLLAGAGVHATFFVVGRQVPSQPGLARRILGEGNMIGNHSWEHAMPPGADSLARTQSAVQQATGFTPCLFRPPGGLVTGALTSAAQAQGLQVVLWSVDTRDWTRPGAAAIARTALGAHAGDIILMHDGGGSRDQTVAALGTVLEGLRHRGLRPVPVEQLLGAEPVYRYGTTARRP